MQIKVMALRSGAKLPQRATSGSAGADLYALLDSSVTILPGERVLISTGIAIEIDSENFGGFVFPRSSLSSKFGVTLANCVGVIDSDYRGEIKVPLVNLGSEPYTIVSGDRIAQLVIMPVECCSFSFVDCLSDTERGCGGFGSTGTN